MVSTPIDPIRMPTTTLSPVEIDEIKELMELGQLPRDFLKRHYDAVDSNVFGVDAPKDNQGRRLEQGHGAKGHETANHFAALKKAEKMGLEDPGAHEAAVAELWARDPERAKRIGLPKPKKTP